MSYLWAFYWVTVCYLKNLPKHTANNHANMCISIHINTLILIPYVWVIFNYRLSFFLDYGREEFDKLKGVFHAQWLSCVSLPNSAALTLKSPGKNYCCGSTENIPANSIPTVRRFTPWAPHSQRASVAQRGPDTGAKGDHTVRKEIPFQIWLSILL